MAKRLATYRVDGKLLDAAAAKAARIGRTVTDVLTQALEEFVKDEPADPLGIKIVTDERMPPGTAAFISRGRDGVSVSAFSLGAGEPEPEPAPKSCKHPRVHGKGVCPDCHEWVASKR
jgi:hypothetical protein